MWSVARAMKVRGGKRGAINRRAMHNLAFTPLCKMPLGVIPLALGIIGNAMSVLAFCSTIPTFWRIAKRKSVEDFSDHPYIFSLLSGMLWTFYGYLILKNGGLMLVIINSIGCIFQYFYLAIYMVFSPTNKQIKTGAFLGGVHLTFVGIVLVVKFLLKETSLQLHVMGICSSMAAIAMFGSPLSIMGLVIYSKSVEYMPFLLSFSFALRTGIWCAYSYVIHDIYLEVTNTIGVALGIFQLFLYMIYYKAPHKSTYEKKAFSHLVGQTGQNQGNPAMKIEGNQSSHFHISIDDHSLNDNTNDKLETQCQAHMGH